LGRKPKNQFTEHDIANIQDSQFKLFDVKLPFAVKVTYDELLNNDQENPITGTASEIIYKSISEKNEIILECEKLGFTIISVEPWSVKFTDICPDCRKPGVPRVEVKNTIDKRHRTWKYEEPHYLPKRENEYWLVYYHKSSRSKCRIQQCIATPHPAFKHNSRKQIDIEKYFFPYCLEWMKNKIYP